MHLRLNESSRYAALCRLARARRAVVCLAVALAAGCGLAPPAGTPPRSALWQALSCTRISVPAGPEDIAIDHARGIAYVASTDRWTVAGRTPRTGPVGRIVRLDLRQQVPQPQDVTPRSLHGPDFQPQGIGFYAGPDGKRLFVVNRRAAFDAQAGTWDTCVLSSTIEVLEVKDEGLSHRRTIRDERHLVRPNDVAPLSASAFFVTNDHAARSCLARDLRDLVGWNGGHLRAYDGREFRVAARDLPFANGVALDADKKILFVAASQDGKVHRFRLGPSGMALRRLPPVALGSALDNLTLAPDGSLLVAAHPKRLAFLLYARGWLGRTHAPSSVTRIDAPASDAADPAEIWRDDGGLLSAASVAGLYRWREKEIERLLIGAKFAGHVLLCDRPLASTRQEAPTTQAQAG